MTIESRDIRLNGPSKGDILAGRVEIPGSKSESNRLLLLKGHYPNLKIENLSDSDDTRFMRQGMEGGTDTVDIHHAGTAMRFLTAYYATRPGSEIVLTGSARMKERPIAVLVNALRSLGAEIEYMHEEGYPPLHISGVTPIASEVTIRADVSSQYISALMLIAPILPEGLTIFLSGTLTSVPYVEMTLALLRQAGIEASFEEDRIRVLHSPSIADRTLVVESDWSAASYYYSLMSLAPEGSRLELSAFRKDSLQGDRRLVDIYQGFGVNSHFSGHVLTLHKHGPAKSGRIELDLRDAPDIAQTIAVSCLGLGLECRLTGLHTLPIKETDRLAALKTELGKLGGLVETGSDYLYLKARTMAMPEGVMVDTYNDHRMAMAFAPLALMLPLGIRDHRVVSKSYPAFWDHFVDLGFELQFVR